MECVPTDVYTTIPSRGILCGASGSVCTPVDVNERNVYDLDV